MEIAIGQKVEVCVGRMDGGAGQLIKASNNLRVHLNDLDGCAGVVINASGSVAVVNLESRSTELRGVLPLPVEILKPIAKKD